MHKLAAHRSDPPTRRRAERWRALPRLALLTIFVAIVPGGAVWPSDGDTPASRTYRVPVDLSRLDTFVTISGSVEMTQLQHLQVDQLPASYRLVPAEGVVQYGQCVDIMLEKPADVLIRVALVRRGNGLAVKISPRIGGEWGELAEFTRDRIQRTLRSLQRHAKDLQQQTSAARKEYACIDAWLASPGTKPLDLHKAIRLRQKLLGQQIATCQRELPVVQRQYASLRALLELTEKLHRTAEIRFTATTRERRQ